MKENEIIYNRTEALKERLNAFIRSITGIDEDYYEKLTQEQLIQLKSATSDINNVFTLKITISFLEWLKNYLPLSNSEYEEIFNEINLTKPNANGFDIVIEKYKLLVEIKSIIPINNGNYYGAAQRTSILKDAINLKYGKKGFTNTEDYIKFIGLIDVGDKTNNAIAKLMTQYPAEKLRTEDKHRKKMHEIVPYLELWEKDKDFNTLSKDMIFIKRLRIE